MCDGDRFDAAARDTAAAIASFLAHCRFNKNLSPRTLRAYTTDLRQLVASLPATCATVVEIGKPELRAYVRGLHEQYRETDGRSV